jgi:hypothetical protein
VYVAEMAFLIAGAYASVALLDTLVADGSASDIARLAYAVPGLILGRLLLLRVIRPGVARLMKV